MYHMYRRHVGKTTEVNHEKNKARIHLNERICEYQWWFGGQWITSNRWLVVGGVVAREVFVRRANVL